MLTIEYVAGFFDGEGCVSYNGRNYLSVQIAGNCYEVINLIQEQFGGSIHTRPNGTNVLQISTRQAESFLNAILPFLIVKKEVAKAGIILANAPILSREAACKAIHELNLLSSPKAAAKGRFHEDSKV